MIDEHEEIETTTEAEPEVSPEPEADPAPSPEPGEPPVSEPAVSETPDPEPEPDTPQVPEVRPVEVLTVDDLLDRLTQSGQSGEEGTAGDDAKEDGEGAEGETGPSDAEGELTGEDAAITEEAAQPLEIIGMDKVIEKLETIQALEEHPLLTTPFEEYTVTEGLLLCLCLAVVIAACVKMIQGGFAWLR